MSTPITTEQRAILDSLICERLSLNPDNRNTIKGVVNNKNSNLVKLLQSNLAWKEDCENITTYFLVKTQSGTILAFFSLRCGEVFQPVDEELIKEAKRYQKNKCIIIDPTADPATKQQAILELIQATRKGWNEKIANDYIRKSTRIEKDSKKDKNKDNHHVYKTFSAVELSVFCNNEATGVKEEWDVLKIPHRRGLSIFWHIILPKIQNLAKLAGCEYLYLFAADDDSDGELVNYYKTKLHFQNPVKLGSNKPSFDYECFFLCQKVNELQKHQIEFYDHFNIDTTGAV